MGSSHSSTTTSQQNSLPDWLTSPYQAALGKATTLAAQPAIGTDTASALAALKNGAVNAEAVGGSTANTLSSMASGNFGSNGTALTSAANGSALSSNPWTTTGNPITTSSALDGMAANGGLDTGYITSSNLNDTANGKFLDPSTNPYITNVANQAADAAQARINAQFGSAGRSNGSGLYAQLFGQGITNASDQVYATNYANERQLQQQAQATLLGDQQSAREAALGRQASAATNIFGAQNSAAENAATRAATAYSNERQLQQQAASGLLSEQLSASGQIPGILSAITDANNSAANAGMYEDNAGLNRQQQYIGLLSQLAAPYGQSNGTSNTTQSVGLGSILGSIAGAGLAGWASGGFKFGK